MYKWFLAFRYLHTKLIAILAIVAVTLCVTMMLVVISVMGGFLDMVKERSRGLLSDLIVDNGSLQGFPFYQEFMDHLKVSEATRDLIAATTPTIHNYGILRVPATNYTKPIRAVGIRLKEYGRVNTFLDGLHYNTYFPGTTNLGPQPQPIVGLDERGEPAFPKEFKEANDAWRAAQTDPAKVKAFDETSFRPMRGEFVFKQAMTPGYVIEEDDFGDRYGVIIGTDVINERRTDGSVDRLFPIGEPLALCLLPLSDTGNITTEGAVTLPVRYADDSRTGVYEIDKMNVYVDFDYLQEQLRMGAVEFENGVSPPRASQILVALKPGVDVNVAAAVILSEWNQFAASLNVPPLSPEGRMLQYVGVSTWEDMQREYITAVEKEKILVTILFWIISAVAIVLIGCVLYMIVEKKTRDIGILKALGASGQGVAGIFLIYSVAIGLLGCILGVLVGATFVHYINDVQDWLASMNPSLRVWSPAVYAFDRIPNVVKTGDVLWITMGALISSMIGALVPAVMAGRVWPVRALRYE